MGNPRIEGIGQDAFPGLEGGDEWLLRVTDLKQYAYCPRVVYYEYCLPGVRPTTFKMQAGIAAQERVEGLEDRRTLRAFGVGAGKRHFNVPVTSARLGCSGQVDMVIETQDEDEPRLIPVDFKHSRKKPGRHFKLQLACYGIMLEESWQIPAAEGFIYQIPNKQAIRVPLTARLRKDTEKSLVAIRDMIEAQRVPEAISRRSRCVDCEFRRFCNDVF